VHTPSPSGAPGAPPALEGAGQQRPPFARGPVLALATGKLLVHLATCGAYGFHRDELYYLACGRHPAWGYVDHPPLVPLAARLVEELAGPSLVALRLLPALAGATVVVLAALLARELGGGRWAQGIAALAVLASPLYLLTNTLFQTVSFDQLVWVAAFVVLARLLAGGPQREWLVVGLLGGVGVLTKHTVGLLAVALLGGLLATRGRRQLASPSLWGGLLLAVLVALPHLLWQARTGYPTVEFVLASSARGGDGPGVFLALQAVFLGPLAVPLAVAGVVHLLRSARFAALGWVYLLVSGLLLAMGGKPYYPGPTYPLAFAAGAVAAEGWWRRRRTAGRSWRALRAAVPAAVVAGSLPLVWMVLPVVPPAAFAAHQERWPHPDFAEMFGWRELAHQVAGVVSALPAAERAGVGLLADAYGEAAALDLYGRRLGLPRAASPHNSYWSWGPPDAATVVAVVAEPAALRRRFAEVVEVAPVAVPRGVVNELAGKRIYLCRRPLRPWPQLWAGWRYAV
jgi:4-amino-4-deoxy-L-arabinose transferase-like glycosyltransferase